MGTRYRPAAQLLFAVAALVLWSCSDAGPADDDAAAPSEELEVDAGPEALEHLDGGAQDASGDADDDAPAASGSEDAELALDLDPETVELACAAVSRFAADQDLAPGDVGDDYTFGETQERVRELRAMVEVAHAGADDDSSPARRLASLQQAEAALADIGAEPDLTLNEISDIEFGRTYDAISDVVTKESEAGSRQWVMGDPFFEDPTALIAAGCDPDEVEAVAGLRISELFHLLWMRQAQGPDPNLYSLAAVFITDVGQMVFNDSFISGSPVDECDPMRAWTDNVALRALGVHPLSVFLVCAGDDGVLVSLGDPMTDLLQLFGRDPQITAEGVAVSADGQAAALIAPDGVTALVATPDEGAEVTTEQLIDAVVAAQPQPMSN